FITYRLTQLILILSLSNTATTAMYTLSLHDALPIFAAGIADQQPLPSSILIIALALQKTAFFQTIEQAGKRRRRQADATAEHTGDRKSTRLNSSHVKISYAVFCLKKKKK